MEYDATTNTSVRVLQYSTGGVLNFISGEKITQFDLFIDAETGFALIAWSGDSNPPRIVNVETAKIILLKINFYALASVISIATDFIRHRVRGQNLLLCQENLI